MPGRRQISHEKEQLIAQRYREGASFPAISAELHTGFSTIRRVLAEAGVSARRRGPKPIVDGAERVRMAERYVAGEPLSVLCAEYGMTGKGIRNVALRAGYDTSQRKRLAKEWN